MAVALIVGASRGLGRALVEEHLKRGWSVTATVRESNVLADLRQAYGDRLKVEALDVTDWAAVDELAGRLRGAELDLLFVNAGISGSRTAPIGEVSADDFTQVMQTNALAPLRLIDRMQDSLAKDAVVAVMSSGMASVADNTFGGWEAYRMSKAALNMGLRSLALRRAGDGRTYLTVAPGWVRTDMGGPDAPLSIDESIPKLVDTLVARRGSSGNAFVRYDNRDLTW